MHRKEKRIERIFTQEPGIEIRVNKPVSVSTNDLNSRSITTYSL